MESPVVLAPEVVVRRVRPADQAALARFYAGLSAESRRARFLGYVPGVSDSTSRSFCTPDHMHAEGFVALLPAVDGEPDVVGHLCLEPAGNGRLELALAVADRQQGQGIGRRLMDTALVWAAEHRFSQVVATAFADNSRVLRLLDSAPHGAHLLPADAGLVDVIVPLTAAMPSDRVAPVLAGRRSRRRGPARTSPAVSRRCRVVWRRRPPPAHDAEG